MRMTMMAMSEHGRTHSRTGRGGIRPWFAAALCLAAATAALPATRSQPPSSAFRQAVNQQVAAARRIAPELGVHIVEIDSGETVYSYNPDTARIAASNTKLFTSAAALDRLGPGFGIGHAVQHHPGCHGHCDHACRGREESTPVLISPFGSIVHVHSPPCCCTSRRSPLPPCAMASLVPSSIALLMPTTAPPDCGPLGTAAWHWKQARCSATV